jgi:hypothetical protein
MLLMYVPLDAGDEVPQGVQKVLDAATAHKQGCIAGAHGWVVEELENEKFEGKLKGYYAAIGWKSIEVHQRYRETEAFKESIPSLRTVAKALNMVSTWQAHWFFFSLQFAAPHFFHQVWEIIGDADHTPHGKLKLFKSKSDTLLGHQGL